MLTLLTTALIFGTLLQDAAPTAAPAPQQDPKAVTLLEEFDAQLYKPQKAGLRELSFDVEMPGPGGAPFGKLSVDWSTADGTSGTFELAESMKGMMAMQPEGTLDMMQQQMVGVREQMALIQVNDVVRDILDESWVTLVGVDGGYVKVVAEPLVEGEGSTRTLLFEDGLLAMTRQTVAGPGGEMERSGTMVWEPLMEGSDKLVLGSTTETAMGMSQTSRFVREKVGKFFLLTKIVVEAPGQSSTIRFSNFRVNGESVALEDAAEPEMVEELPSEG